jgi:two-component system, NarL family, response regulator
LNEDRRCLIVDGHAVTRIGVRKLLDPDYDVEEASTWSEALDGHGMTGGFDVAVIQLDRRSDGDDLVGGALIKAIRKEMPGAGIVALAGRADRYAAAEAIEAGASAYVAKTSSPEAIRRAVDAAADSGKFVDPAARRSPNGDSLTRRQRQTLQLLADGHSTTEVAHRLHLSAETVRTHTKASLARLGARDRAHAVAIALRSGLIE